MLTVLFAISASAKQEFILDEINPANRRFSAFNSYKYNLLLIALTQKNQKPFNCEPNRYIFYDYGTEDYFEIQAGNLKLNSNYSKIFLTKIHSIGRMDQYQSTEWKKAIKILLDKMNISSQTMESSKMESNDGMMACWQQPQMLNMRNNKPTSFHFLAANLCKHAWCSELYWTDSDNIQFWVQLNPKKIQLIRLNTNNSVHEFIKQSPPFYKKSFPQLNAPRDNLVTPDNLSGKTIILTSANKRKVVFTWKELSTGKIRISLFRDKDDKIAAQKTKNKIKKLLNLRQIPQAFQMIKYGFWLEPENTDIKMERLKAYASLLLFDEFFKSLKNDFSNEERFSACQKLHMEKSIRDFWKQDSFSKKFEQICP